MVWRSTIRRHPAMQDVPWAMTLCFTGHRPEGLPQLPETRAALDAALGYRIERALEMGFTHFLVGMADGIDYMAAMHLFRLRAKYPGLCVIGAVPGPDHAECYRRSGYDMSHLEAVLAGADQTVVLDGDCLHRASSAYLGRDRFMVENASAIIAVCSERRSGSLSTFRMALEKKLAYCRLFPYPPDGTLPSPQEWPADCYGL